MPQFNFLLKCGRRRPTRMPNAGQNGTIAWLLILRSIEVWTAGALLFSARDTYNLVHAHQDLHYTPKGENVLFSQRLVYAVGYTTFVWMFVSFFSISMSKGWWIFVHGIADLALAVLLSVGAGMQAAYLPSSYSKCSHANSWETVNGGPSFFYIAGLHKKKGGSQGACHQFVSVWALASSVVFFRWLSAYVGIFSDERELSVLNPYRPLAWFTVVFFGPPYWFFKYFKPAARFSYRYLRRLSRHTRGMERLELPANSKFIPSYERMSVSNPKLHQILTIEHVLLPIISNLHYQDVFNLGLTSRSIREAVFPIGDMHYRLDKLKKFSCDEETKANCLYCNRKICDACTKVRMLSALSGARHIDNCQPYCSDCYFATFSKRYRDFKKECTCGRYDMTFQDHNVCRSCHKATDIAMLQETRNKRYQQEIRDRAYGVRGPREKMPCAKCKKELPYGVRWWVCKECKGECRDKVHPPWISSTRTVDLEKGEAPEYQGRKERWKWRRILTDLL